MIRKFRTLLLLIVTLTTITGCWSRKELNDLAITVAIGMDKKGDQYKVYAQIVNPNEIAVKKGGGGKGAPVSTYSETGTTLFEAFRKMTTNSPRKLYFAHLRMLVISEQMAKEGIGKALDVISREPEFRTDFFIVIAKGLTAEKILQIYTIPQEIIPANTMFKSLQTSNIVWATTVKMTKDELIADIISDGKEPVLTGVHLTGDKNDEKVQTEDNIKKITPISSIAFSDLAVFKNDKLVGWLNDNDSKAYNYIHGYVKSTVEPISCPEGGNLTLEVNRTKSKIKGKLKNNDPEVNIDLQVEANVGDVECKIDLTKLETIDDLETRAEQKIKKMLTRTIHKVKTNYDADIFGFGEAIHRASPKEWNNLKKNWDGKFVTLPVNVIVDVKIRNTGTITDSILNKIKE
jgi:spore germination protein KC